MSVIKVLVEDCGAIVDLTEGELFKDDYDDSSDNY